jgi:peptidoglycan L-alanyl-D-glutamate endopeptidase CwlK
MSDFKLSSRSLARLEGVHPDLVRVVKAAITMTDVDFGVTEGPRTEARQRELVASGASQTMRSRHLTGHAVDLVAYVGSEIRWDWPLYHKIAAAMDAAALTEGVPLEWGGRWTTLRDGPHFQLPWSEYPA